MEDNVLEIAVSLDGTWSKCKFTVNFVVGFLISIDTRQMLDFGFASKICIECLLKKEQFGDNSEEFRTWYASHSANCTENHTGSSGAMGKDIARR